jgi:hypothetical protein
MALGGALNTTGTSALLHPAIPPTGSIIPVAFSFPSPSLKTLQNVMAVTEFLAFSGKVGVAGKGHQMKKIFGLQRHKLLTGDRHENGIDVLGTWLCGLSSNPNLARTGQGHP